MSVNLGKYVRYLAASCQKGHPLHESMGSDKKIRQWRAPGFLQRADRPKNVASQERGFPNREQRSENPRAATLPSSSTVEPGLYRGLQFDASLESRRIAQVF